MFVDVTFDAEEELGRNGPTHKHNFRHFPRIQNRTNNQNETTVYKHKYGTRPYSFL